MYKLFTQTQATDLIGVVGPLLGDLQEGVKDALRLKHEGETVRSDSLRFQQVSAELKFVLESAQATKSELDSLGVLVKDIEQGLVDFPSKLGAEMIYLCWAQGEDAVTHYHALNQEAQTRQPLPTAQPGASAARA